MASNDEIELVLTRIEQLMPPSAKLIIGGSKPYSKEDLVLEVEKDSEIGNIVVGAHMMYIKSFFEEKRFESLRPKLVPGP